MPSPDSSAVERLIATLYAQAFRAYGTRALWYLRRLEHPTREDALVIARALRIEGDMAARRLAEQIEKLARADR
ncbi:MAG: hypothetical protein ACREC6_10835 [Hyphomicrobiaceae bacterium]